jgi:type II secretory pathway component GspD/PulD (secretin)
LYEALKLIFQDKNISLHIDGSMRSGSSNGNISATGISGNINDVMASLSKTMGFFYHYDDNILSIYPEQNFIVEIPPIINQDTMAGMSNTFKFLGAHDVYLDRDNKSLFFRGNRKAKEQIAAYLNNIRQTRSMIIYDMHIMMVDLNDVSGYGINWQKMQYGFDDAKGAQQQIGVVGSANANGGNPLFSTLPNGGSIGPVATTTATTTSSSNGFFGAVFANDRVSLNLLLEYLKTQGTVKMLSQPKLAIMSGSKGQINIGGTTTYVSKVGSNSSISYNMITVETKDLSTGINLNVFGDVSDNTVYTNISLLMKDLVRFDSYTALGTQLKMPVTTDRKLNTNVRARPGDLILLGGLTIDTDQDNTQNGIGGSSQTKSTAKSEIVLALKPRIVKFVSKLSDVEKGNGLDNPLKLTVPKEEAEKSNSIDVELNEKTTSKAPTKEEIKAEAAKPILIEDRENVNAQ